MAVRTLTRKPDLKLELGPLAQVVHRGDRDHLALAVVALAAGARLVALLSAQPAAVLLALAPPPLDALLLRAPGGRAHVRRAHGVVPELALRRDHQRLGAVACVARNIRTPRQLNLGPQVVFDKSKLFFREVTKASCV